MGIWNVMENRSKPGMVFTLRTQSIDKHCLPLRSHRAVICGLVVAFVSLSCAIGVLDQNDPLFSASNGGGIQSPIPSLNFPTDRAVHIITNDPVAEVSQQSSTDIPTPPSVPVDTAPLLYYTQAGDTLPVIATRFGVDVEEIKSPDVSIPSTGLLIPNTFLVIPHMLVNTTSSHKIIPDSELVYSPSAVDFDVEAYINQLGGYLSRYNEWLGSTGWTSGPEIVQRIATENSINPRLLLALIEYQSGWVYGQPSNPKQEDYPLGKVDLSLKGLYSQLAWTVNQLSIGYYGWREGWVTDIQFSDGVSARLAPDLNSGTVALQYYIAQINDTPGWLGELDSSTGIPALYDKMFGDQWIRAMDIEPLYPPNLSQPAMILPFLIDQLWSYTGGPHGAWERDGARAAIDFAPGSTESGCVKSYAWVVAIAPGLIVRASNGAIVEDLDGDGNEQTGWNILYLHVNGLAIKAGDWVETSDYLGHPSCEGGIATGTHVHIARKYNGEWISADGPLPFVLSGWTVHAGSKPYEGTMTKENETITSSVFGAHESLIKRTRDNP
jgi:LysM repeat protein/murein DD-endopeptidase MepM/ murein hydrolase activator NlpD